MNLGDGVRQWWDLFCVLISPLASTLFTELLTYRCRSHITYNSKFLNTSEVHEKTHFCIQMIKL